MTIFNTKAEFIEAANKVHATTCDYTNSKYTTYKNLIEILCRKCRHTFTQKPKRHLLGFGCPTCGKRKSRRKTHDPLYTKQTTAAFIESAIKIHGNKYGYSKTVCTNVKSQVAIYCRTCRAYFEQDSINHLGGKGCRKCSYEVRGLERRKTADEFIAECISIHNGKYNYDKFQYVKGCLKSTVTCNTCTNDFMITPNNHLRGYGCPVCSKSRRYSKMAISWLEYESKQRRVKIRHAENGGEYRIPRTRFKVDGFNVRGNIVFEFYGDCYHGNPKRFKPKDYPNPYSTQTARQLYQATIDREQILVRLGYTVVSIWEHDWKLLKAKPVCNRF